MKDVVSNGGKARNVFPENPKNLLSDLPRDAKGHIYASDNIRIRPEQHLLRGCM
ncbi:hypothetical protein wcw_0622 [Waddlia chondrophila WSU 86-1044]|uniref:Uncharacterized protein n=1 Tax=Waddlia chondrophila (strain ATCC VR-1470 / WSU 86-1044) TaxID=716544 RepID=D6YV29_WADCW|nr:hypothetical protein wcw_0622 [Waddlia chondrophila WSU 86-1044]